MGCLSADQPSLAGYAVSLAVNNWLNLDVDGLVL